MNATTPNMIGSLYGHPYFKTPALILILYGLPVPDKGKVLLRP
jgi:hypothetical protein